MKVLFISENAPQSLLSMLHGMDFSVRLLPSEKSLPEPVSSHADMLIFSDGERLIVQKGYYEDNAEIFEGVDMLLAEEEFGDSYPRDVLLNAFSFNGYLFGRMDSLSKALKDCYERRVDLRQGYASCSTLIFGSNAVTADKAIAAALEMRGCRVLLIPYGDIQLKGYDYGFIGGASFVCEDRVIFFGDITKHPKGRKIIEFVQSGGYRVFFDKENPLTDLGSAVLTKLPMI